MLSLKVEPEESAKQESCSPDRSGNAGIIKAVDLCSDDPYMGATVSTTAVVDSALLRLGTDDIEDHLY